MQILQNFGVTAREVALALLPLLAVFLISHIFFLKLSRKKFINICAGFALMLAGLSLFLQGVYAGFLPMGRTMGGILSALPSKWILVPFGFILGFTAILAEPAVRVLNYQVEKITSGYIPQKVMLYTLSVGGAISISLSMARIITGVPLRYLVIPGYLIAFLLMFYSRKSFVAIAFDSGGVATGPMTATFITSLVIGIASGIEGRNPFLDGLGMVAMMALLPILTVLILGLLYDAKERKIKADISSENKNLKK